jgi:Ca-activated chloride channel family protein
MKLANPYALLLLFIVPWLFFLNQRWQRPAVISYSSIQDLVALPRTFMTRLRRALPVLRALALIFCILALARPQWGIEAVKVYGKGIAIAMVVDISSSMAALDLKLDGNQSNRLDVVKQTFRTFVQGGDQALAGRDGDLIGMVTFARYADSLSPLTLDHSALLALLDQVKIVPSPEEDGTAIGEAIVLGVKLLLDHATTSRVMILLTDGSNNAGHTTPLQAAQIAKALGVKIYTIGTGTRGTASIPVRLHDGGMTLRRTQVFIDEYTLTQIARFTGGQYFRATDSATLQAIYAEIDRLEKTTTVAERYQQYVEGFPLYVMVALGFLLLEMVLVNTCWRTVP